MDLLKVVKAIYYNPQVGLSFGSDVTSRLQNLIKNDVLDVSEAFNSYFGDPFPGVHKKLDIEFRFKNKKFKRVYDESDRINFPDDLAKKEVFSNKESFFSKLSWQLFIGFIGLLVLVVGYMITEGKLPQVLTYNSSFATSTPYLNDIFKKKDSYNITADKQNFIKKYEDTFIYARGTLNDIDQSDMGYVAHMSVENNAVACVFDFSYEKELLLFKPGQTLNFFGIFTTGGYGFYQGVSPWYIKRCSLDSQS